MHILETVDENIIKQKGEDILIHECKLECRGTFPRATKLINGKFIVTWEKSYKQIFGKIFDIEHYYSNDYKFQDSPEIEINPISEINKYD